jgi:hypothetical protein
MSNTLELTQEQRKAYDRFIRARDKVRKGSKWVKPSPIESSVDIEGFNHPFYVANEAYQEYMDAFMAWLDIEPKFRDAERMRASRGDYGLADSWEDKVSRAQDTYSKLKEG